MSSTVSPHLDVLIDMAANSRMAVLYYRKGVTSKTVRPRLIEPYAFTEGKQDLMVRAYQIAHGEDTDEFGWRFFMAHKIDRVEPTGMAFVPRRKVTITSGEVHEGGGKQNPHWASEGRRAYRDMVGDALADGELSVAERWDLDLLVSQHKLTPEDVRFVHTSVYHRCLGAVLDDGFISDVEVEQIRVLHKAMKSLGWSVGD